LVTPQRLKRLIPAGICGRTTTIRAAIDSVFGEAKEPLRNIGGLMTS
jgi:hypothetical protein